jgi:RNA polymerase sigma-70 factor (ECF subfamily)
MRNNSIISNSEPDVSTDTLVALCAGEEWAYNEVYRRYSGQVKDFLAALMNNEEDARELNHDIFLDLWLHRERIIPGKGVRGFLYVRAKNMAMNWFAHKKVREKYENFCTHVDDAYALSADEGVIARETQVLAEIAMRGLSERKQNIWRLSKEEGMTPSEIAKQLNVSVSTVTHSLTEIKRHLSGIVAMFTIVFQS